MIRLKVMVEPQGPLILGKGMDSAQNVRESRDYIAGSVVRGALAQTILERLHRHSTSRRQMPLGGTSEEQNAFETVFMGTSPARFGYLYPTYLQRNGTVDESFPAPVTTRACKPHTTQHQVLDTLRVFLRRQLPPSGCPQCGERIERWRGFLLRLSDGEYDYCARAPRRPLVRVGLNRWTETAEERILYVLEAIVPRAEPDKPLAFVGHWTMSEKQWQQLQVFLERFFLRESAGYRLRLGSARARGLGEVILHCEETTFPDVSPRLDAFQNGLPDTEHYLYFSLTVRSPVLVYDETGLPANSLTPTILRSYLPSVPDKLELMEHATFVEAESLSGWSQAWGLPKPVTSVIAAGSVFTYRVPKSEEDAVLNLLTAIETQGLGERRAEGLGDLVACDPFHISHESPMEVRDDAT